MYALMKTSSSSENGNNNKPEWGLWVSWWGRWDLLPALNGDISRDPLFSTINPAMPSDIGAYFQVLANSFSY
jgi:hypothetical protein